jgi:hypothetical protein
VGIEYKPCPAFEGWEPGETVDNKIDLVRCLRRSITLK